MSTVSKGEMDNMTLPALFEQARQIHSAIEESGLDQDKLQKACDMLNHCEAMIDQLGIFSPNESKEDISTTDLKYLLVPFYLGELTEKIKSSKRMQSVRISLSHLKDFVATCEKLELMPKEEIEMLGNDEKDTPAARRAKKIARFKRQKAAESKLQEIKERKERRHRSMQAAAIDASIEHGEETTLDDDGEEEREAWLTTISLALCKACDLLDSLKKEEDLISEMEKNVQNGDKESVQLMLDERSKTAEAWHKEAARKSQFVKPAQPITCARFAMDVLEGRAKPSEVNDHKHQPLVFGPASLVGGNLTTEREQIAAQVFQPSHRLPTMSIEEAGLREMQMMNKWQERVAKQIEEANSSWVNDGKRDPSSDEEAAELKARAWDDWKDENPRGAGNKKLTPCG
eukprot:TRINITY_DN3680_c0_g1_i1.p1 TRINITY_DN3680_c0_g1~~TRINITY_DN3680_c0_g1_i1.p1  ORF type:complete len:401 (-),score=124.07 TRINITY_DN3680_c0_g1_i1:452-1654(-)